MNAGFPDVPGSNIIGFSNSEGYYILIVGDHVKKSADPRRGYSIQITGYKA
jgi:hypothetical protein